MNQTLLNLPRVASRVTDDAIARRRADGVTPIPVSAYPDVPLPDAILHQLEAAARHPPHAPARGLTELRQGLAAAFAAETGARLDPDREILVTQGAMHALNLAFTVLLEPGDEVLMPAPFYFTRGLVELRGAHVTPVPLPEATGFALDLDRLARAVGPRTRAILLTTPANPSGFVCAERDIQGVADLAERRNLYVICDESYDRFVYDGRRHVSLLSRFDGGARAIVVRSFTKSYGLSAWRVGCLAAGRAVIDQAAKVLEWQMLFGNYLSQKAAALVLASGAPWLNELPGQYQRNRDALLARVRACPGLSAVTPAGNPFLFINVAASGVEEARLSRTLLERGLANTAGSAHGADGYVRIAFGGPMRAVDRAADVLTDVLSDSARR